MMHLLAQVPDTSLLSGDDADRWITVLLAIISFGVVIVFPVVMYLANAAQKQRKRAEIAEIKLVDASITTLKDSIERRFNAVDSAIASIDSRMQKIEHQATEDRSERHRTEMQMRERLTRIEHIVDELNREREGGKAA